METKANLAKAIIAVMQEVKGIEKSMTIGTGSNAYKGVPDQEVKKIIGEAMAKNGLCILPISVKPNVRIDRWDALDYNGKPTQKQSVFTDVTTEYLLLHTSGESQVLSGYGHGIDSQDKGAGKASTYALKYVLLYTFLVPTGKIDDADNTHSDSIETPVKPNLPELEKTALESLKKCKTLVELKNTYDSFTAIQKNIQTVITEKDKLKATLK